MSRGRFSSITTYPLCFLRSLFSLSLWRKPFATESFVGIAFLGDIVLLWREENIIVISNTEISSTFLCDELVQPDETDSSTCKYQDSLSHPSCQGNICLSQYDSGQLMGDRLSVPFRAVYFRIRLCYDREADIIDYLLSPRIFCEEKTGHRCRKLSYATYFHREKPVCPYPPHVHINPRRNHLAAAHRPSMWFVWAPAEYIALWICVHHIFWSHKRCSVAGYTCARINKVFTMVYHQVKKSLVW